MGIEQHEQLDLDGMSHLWRKPQPEHRGVRMERNRFLAAQALRVDGDSERLEFVRARLENPSTDEGEFEVRTAGDFELIVWVNGQTRHTTRAEALRVKTQELAVTYLDGRLETWREQAATLRAQIDDAD